MYLGLDYGTSEIKALLIDAAGNITVKKVPIQIMKTPSPMMKAEHSFVIARRLFPSLVQRRISSAPLA